MKLCVDCVFYEPFYTTVFWFKKEHAEYSKCKHPNFISLVDGSAQHFCEIMRYKSHDCGPEAKFWVGKHGNN